MRILVVLATFLSLWGCPGPEETETANAVKVMRVIRKYGARRRYYASMVIVRI